MKHRALISVYDKIGIVDFCRSLINLGWELISTGGTLDLLREEGLETLSVEEVTNYPEVFGGRLKTLHPTIHGGILNRRDHEEDQRALSSLGIENIDMVVNNLYPFEEVVRGGQASVAEIIEQIDIGGPAMVRAAAKNHTDVIVVTDVADYTPVLHTLSEDQMTADVRAQLAAKAFSLTAYYDAIIADYMLDQHPVDTPYLVPAYRFKESLRYGENPHQTASYYSQPFAKDYHFIQRQGKTLSYNNYNDIQAALDLVKEFDLPAAVVVKHGNPCGVAVADQLDQAFHRAYEADSVSIYGGVVALNRTVDLATAERLSEIFLEIIVAPGFEEEALKLLQTKEKLRLIQVAEGLDSPQSTQAFRQALDGLLVQDKDLDLYSPQGLEVMTDRQPSLREQEDLDFAWRVAKHIHSNGMVVAKDGVTLGIGQGEVRRVWALEKALDRASRPTDGAVVASDGFFFEDSMDLLADYGIQAVIQPGGSIHDPAVIERAHELGISLVFTSIRHFKH